tara:strand:+ start:917 stop:1177 length:261 start_codon:yes stop_codon:yes gene_type:complete
LEFERSHANNPSALLENFAGLQRQKVVLFRATWVGWEQYIDSILSPSPFPWLDWSKPFLFNSTMTRNCDEFLFIDIDAFGNFMQTL